MPTFTSSGNADVFISSSTPLGAGAGDLWVDTSSSPYAIKSYDGSSWNGIVSSSASITIGGRTDTIANFLVGIA